MSRNVHWVMGVILAAWIATTAVAAEPAAVIEEIIVTAERKASSLQDTPIAISVFGEEFLESSQVTSIQDIAPFTPGLNFTQVSNFAQLNMRGIGLEQINLGGEPGVAFHQDGVYIARPFVNEAVFLDLARVEVLRGPQGTLYGRNATGGSVNLISNRPDDEAFLELSVGLGNYDRFRVAALTGGALSDTVRGRLALVSDERDGYLDNLLNGEDLEDNQARAARGQLEIDLSETATLLISADYLKEDETGPVFRTGEIGGTAPALGGRTDPDPWKIYQDGPEEQDITAKGASVQLDWSFDTLELMSLTAYRENSFSLLSDLDGTDFFWINEDLHESAEQFSQEFQLSSNNGDNLSWMVGMYYFQEDGELDYAFPVPALGTTIRFIAEQETTAYAVFGQLTFDLSSDLSLTLGLRYSDEEKEGSTQQTFFVVNNVDVKDSWTAFTPRLVLDYQVNNDTLVYASIARGFKAGGINTASLQSNAYDPEYIWNYEVGLKADLFERRVRANLAAFYYEYEDLQVNQFAVGQTFIENAADAEGQGLEAELSIAVSTALRLDFTLAYLDTEFKDYVSDDAFRPTLGTLDLAGNDLPRAPEFSGSAVATYELELGNSALLGFRAEFQHQDRFYFTPFNTDFAEGGRFDLFNAQISYRSADDRLLVAVFGRNLTDEEYEQAVTVSGINGGTLELYGSPRTYGVEARYRF